MAKKNNQRNTNVAAPTTTTSNTSGAVGVVPDDSACSKSIRSLRPSFRGKIILLVQARKSHPATLQFVRQRAQSGAAQKLSNLPILSYFRLFCLNTTVLFVATESRAAAGKVSDDEDFLTVSKALMRLSENNDSNDSLGREEENHFLDKSNAKPPTKDNDDDDDDDDDNVGQDNGILKTSPNANMQRQLAPQQITLVHLTDDNDDNDIDSDVDNVKHQVAFWPVN